MRGRYLIRNRPKAAAIGMMDALLAVLPRASAAVPADPERILVANWAHLGDVTTSLGALRALRARWPQARIGMIVGSWGRAAVEGTGLVDDIHVIDHWMANRSAGTSRDKRGRYAETRSVALRAIRAARYEIGIDLYPFFPPAHPLFRTAGIPVRVGYTSGGFGPLLSHPVPWRDEERPMADQYRDLLDRLTPDRPFDASLFQPHRERETLAPLPEHVREARPYLVIHPGAGSPTRHWGVERWRSVMARLRREAPMYRIVLTGAGADDQALTGALAGDAPGTIDLAGRATWEEFTSVLADAALVICPDTATGHVAALFDVPTVVIFTGTNSPAKWAPYGQQVSVLVRPVRCAPCNRAGCEAMACFLGVEPDEVVDAALARLALAGAPL